MKSTKKKKKWNKPKQTPKLKGNCTAKESRDYVITQENKICCVQDFKNQIDAFSTRKGLDTMKWTIDKMRELEQKDFVKVKVKIDIT